MKTLELGEFSDVIFVRSKYNPFDRRTNVPYRKHVFSEDYEWGYRGAGPCDLAFNILLHFADEHFALEHYADFVLDVVANLPARGGVLRAQEILAWISEKRSGKTRPGHLKLVRPFVKESFEGIDDPSDILTKRST